MRTIEKLLLKACSYTVLILTMFYTFAQASKFASAYIDFGTFAIFLLFGAAISLADLVLGCVRLRVIYRIMIHYAVLLFVFCSVFVVKGKISLESAGTIFTSIIIFTVLYAIMFAIVYILRRATIKGDDFLAERTTKNDNKNIAKSQYKPKFK